MNDTVYVVMGNDFPEAVFDNEPAAEAYIALLKARDRVEQNSFGRNYMPRIYWRTYAFEVQS